MIAKGRRLPRRFQAIHVTAPSENEPFEKPAYEDAQKYCANGEVARAQQELDEQLRLLGTVR